MGVTHRELAKAVQSELAEANTVAEESLSSMATVRSHAAEDSSRAAYQHRLHLFYRLCVSHLPRCPNCLLSRSHIFILALSCRSPRKWVRVHC